MSLSTSRAGLGDFDCYRVRVNLPDGPEYLWIDQKTFVLRQFVVPIAVGPRPAEDDRQANRLWLVINFERARLGGDIDPKAFQFDVPEGVKKTRVLVQASPYDLVGQKLPEFKFVDLQGKPWSSQSLAGKAAVIYFWRTDAAEGRPDDSRDRAVVREVQGQRQGGRAGREPRPSGHAGQDDRGCGQSS